MSAYPDDIYAEPANMDSDTLANLGPLAPLAGVWEGMGGVDVSPKVEGPRTQPFWERISLQPVDPVDNGPQLIYALRYHTHITKPDKVKTFHEQVGYWLWEPATGNLFYSLTIPRAQVVMATGRAAATDRSFTVTAARGSTTNGICSGPFLEENFRTDAVSMTVTVNGDGTWSYSETTTLAIKGVPDPFRHTDENRLIRIAPPKPNPLMAAKGAKAS